jgi:predicted acetylornithine/succinylornithine family transaminase
VRGEGCRLFDEAGREYLDLVSGLGAACLGHAHPALREALSAQAGILVHCSNLFVNGPQVRLAEWLCARSFAERAFFCNSGAEAVEASIKLARRRGHDRGEAERAEIVTFEGSFHGRTYGAMSVTGQARIQHGFAPLVPGIVTVPFADAAALERAVSARTAAVLLEPIQGEGGVRPFADGFLRAVRELCTAHGALMVCDEVQSGMGRTGRLLAIEHAGIAPDVALLGKALGGGVPIAALLTTAGLAAHLVKGAHGTTYGGNPLVCAAALAVSATIERDDLMARAEELGARFRSRLARVSRERLGTEPAVRGRGLMIGVAVDGQAGAIAKRLFEQGIIVNAVGEQTLRLLPPYVIAAADLDGAAEAIVAAIAAERARPAA